MWTAPYTTFFLPPARPLEFPRVLGRTRPARSALAPLGAGPARVSLWLALPPARARPGPLSLGPALSLSARPSLSLGPARPPLSWTRPLPARHGPARHDAPGPVSLHARSARPVEAQVRRARPGPPAPSCPSSFGLIPHTHTHFICAACAFRHYGTPCP